MPNLTRYGRIARSYHSRGLQPPASIVARLCIAAYRGRARQHPKPGSTSHVRRELLAVPGVRRAEIEELGDYTVRATVEGGDNLAVAVALYSALPAFIATVGNVSVEYAGMAFSFDR